MKETLITILRIIPILFTMVIWISCSQDMEMPNDASNNTRKIKVHLKVNKVDFDSQGTTRTGGSGTGWENGETIYLRFDNGSVTGTAVYNAYSNDWRVNLSGSLTRDTHGKVEAYYFDQPASATSTKVSLAATTGVYHDIEGIYNIPSSGDLDIFLTLQPITSRIRFAGEPGLDIKVLGLSYYTAYNVAKNELVTSSTPVLGKIIKDGYTPYYYCSFADSTRLLTISNSKDGDDVLFLKCFMPSVLKIGEGGHITIPTEDTMKGWVNAEKEFTVTGNEKTVTFKMKGIVAGTFQMGAITTYHQEEPIHTVTITKGYYIGETEVTQELWYAVMGQSPTLTGESTGRKWDKTYNIGDNYPAYWITYEDCQQFINKLNTMTGQTFRLPTEAEWEFAARGGVNSKGYTYAGSNIISDVAWYKDNAVNLNHADSQVNGTRQVAQKTANELGLYDMSGNVMEWCLDYYAPYPSTVQTDPAITTNIYVDAHVARGGCWDGNEFMCRVTTRDGIGRGLGRECGLRLALSN